MRRIAILLCLLFAATAYSQIDTIHSWERIPGVFYEDSNWWDHYCFDVPCGYPNWDYNTVEAIGLGGFRTETARYLHSDTTIKIIGIAASAAFYCDTSYTIDTVLSHRPHEYFRLYRADSTGMVPLREVLWDTAKVRRRNSVAFQRRYDHNANPYYGETFFDLYEAYFETPVLVKDSFYVSATTYGNYVVPDTVYHENAHGQWITVSYPRAHPTVAYVGSAFEWFLPKYEQFAPRPNFFKQRSLSHVPSLPDGEWQIIGPGPYHSDYYINIFPIIDTTFIGVFTGQDTCPAPQGLRVGHVDRNSALLEWDNVAEQFELSLAREWDTTQDETILPCGASFMALSGLDSAAWYIAKVRSVCGNTSVSLWSDTIRFFVPGDTCTSGNGDTTSTDPTDPTEGIETPAERYTYLMPNPATEQVTVMSSFRIGKVTVYDAAGNRILRTEPNGMSATIDLTTLPSGVYIVSIATNKGTVHKRLIKK